MPEPTLLEQLDSAEAALRAAMTAGERDAIINALSALCAAAAARCMVGVEDIADGPVHEYGPGMHDGSASVPGLDALRENLREAHDGH